MANCTVIKSGASITPKASEKVEDLIKAVDAISMPISHPFVGDAVLYDSTTDEIITVNADDLTAEAYPTDRYTPIGVVAIPASHNVYGDGKCGVVSLMYMSKSSPDSGSTSTDTMYWGYNGGQTLPSLKDSVPLIGTGENQAREITETAVNGYLPSDNFSDVACEKDQEAFYYSASNNAIPSPYLAGSSKNSSYSQTEEPSAETNALSDFDGKGNSEILIDAVTVDGWKTASSITNSSSSGNYPAACCCWRFHTAGTEQGDWYLPACGELGYVVNRLKTINATISNIISIYGSSVAGVISTTTGYYHWTSTEYSSSIARTVTMGNGSVNYTTKNDGTYPYVRAFLRV